MEKIVDYLKAHGELLQPVKGSSMLPLLREKTDVVLISQKTEKLRPLDVALYIRKEDGAYILHRVIECMAEGYVIRGDNCYNDEFIAEDDVIGVMKGYYRKDKYVSCEEEKYLEYARRRVNNYPCRKHIQKLKWKIKSVYRKILKRNS